MSCNKQCQRSTSLIFSSLHLHRFVYILSNDPIISSIQPPEKRSRFDADGSSNGNGQIKVDEEDDTTTTIFDENAVKRLILQLDKRMLKNREMRIKHADEPQKFMDSELELNVAVQASNNNINVYR